MVEIASDQGINASNAASSVKSINGNCSKTPTVGSTFDVIGEKLEVRTGRIDLAYCNKLYALKQKFKGLPPKSDDKKMRWCYASKVIRKFIGWLKKSQFLGENALKQRKRQLSDDFFQKAGHLSCVP